MSFQENLKYYREKAGYKSAKEFANTLGIPPNTYVGYEVRGREPKFDTLCKIADLLEVSTDDLLGRTSNILGNNEDEKLKKTINDLLSKFDYLKLDNINNDDISFYLYKDKPIVQTSIDKYKLIQLINDYNDWYQNKKYIALYKFIFSITIEKELFKIDKKLKTLRESLFKHNTIDDTLKINEAFEIKNDLLELKNLVYKEFPKIWDAPNIYKEKESTLLKKLMANK